MIDEQELKEAEHAAAEAQWEYPELADLEFDVVKELAMQGFKCCACGESVLTSRQPYRILKYKDLNASPGGLEHTPMFQRFWRDAHYEGFEVLKEVKM